MGCLIGCSDLQYPCLGVAWSSGWAVVRKGILGCCVWGILSMVLSLRGPATETPGVNKTTKSLFHPCRCLPLGRHQSQCWATILTHHLTIAKILQMQYSVIQSSGISPVWSGEFIHSYSHSIIESFIHSFIQSVNQSVSQSIDESINQSSTYSLIHSFSHTFIHWLTHSLPLPLGSHVMWWVFPLPPPHPPTQCGHSQINFKLPQPSLRCK